MEVYDLVKDTTQTTGTGAFTLDNAAPTGYQTYGAATGATDKEVFYHARSADETEWEIGIGTYTHSGTTLSRTTVLQSSNSDALVSFTAAGATVFCPWPAMDRRPAAFQMPRTPAGRYLCTPVGASNMNVNGVLTLDTIYAVPISVNARTPFDRIAFQVNSAIASSNARMGIYADGGNGSPGALILDAGTIATDTTGAKDIVISRTLDPGCYWLALVASHSITVSAASLNGNPTWLGRSAVASSPSGAASAALAYGPLPAAFPGSPTFITASSSLYNFGLRAA